MGTTQFLAVWAALSVPIVIFLAVFALSSRKRIWEGEKEIEKLRNFAFKDLLTDVWNRRPFEKQMEAFFHQLHAPAVTGRDRRSKMSPRMEALTVVAIDVDGLKGANDKFGHGCGDELLRRVAIIFTKTAREDDVVCRWGGDEFFIALPNTTEESALVLVERIRATVEEEALSWRDKGLPPITISAGVAEFDGDSHPDELIQRADAELYRSKKEGKNRVSGTSFHKDKARLPA